MISRFARLDDVLFDKFFQPASDLIAHRAGIARTLAACWCVDAASLAWIGSRVPNLSETVKAWNSTQAFTGLAMLLLGLVALVSLRTLFRRAGAKSANPLRAAMRPHRAIALLMLVAQIAQLRGFGLADVADMAMLICAAAAMYLGACAERPPVRRYAPIMRAVGAGQSMTGSG